LNKAAVIRCNGRQRRCGRTALPTSMRASGFAFGINFAILRRFGAVAARMNSSRAPFGLVTQSVELENALEVREQHLDSFCPIFEVGLKKRSRKWRCACARPKGTAIMQGSESTEPLPNTKPIEHSSCCWSLRRIDYGFSSGPALGLFEPSEAVAKQQTPG
jgi:hypothetical protein